MNLSSLFRLTTTILRRISVSSLRQQQQCQQRLLCNTTVCMAGGKLRVRRGQAEDATSYGPMTDLPDFTIVTDVEVGDDRRAAVMTKRQMRRQMRRVRIGATIASLLREIEEQKVETGKYGILEEQHRDY